MRIFKEKSKPRALAGCVGLTVLLVGCSTTSSAIRTGSQTFEATTPASVQVYFSPDQVPGKYEEIGRVSTQKRAQTAWTDVNEEKLIEILKKEAASLGAQAIILQSIVEDENPVSSGAMTWNESRGFGGGGSNTFNKKSATAIAIRFV
ncbi:MAG: hypothetical protein KC964_31775 [Candidatus Omnitrophica bacterium]|nr:hypothetical protein [Candidatus Omnitrophota bacterium]